MINTAHGDFTIVVEDAWQTKAAVALEDGFLGPNEGQRDGARRAARDRHGRTEAG
jgi:hypothetical protein